MLSNNLRMVSFVRSRLPFGEASFNLNMTGVKSAWRLRWFIVEALSRNWGFGRDVGDGPEVDKGYA